MNSTARRSRGATGLKKKILDASLAIVMSEGYSALSMRRLAREIGYSATSIYLYFENRESIVAELGRGGLEVLETYVTVAVEETSPEEALKKFARQYLQFSREHPESYRIIFMQDSTLADAMFRSSPEKDGGGAGQRVFSRLVTAFDCLRKDDAAWKGVMPLRAAEVLWTALHGIISLKLTCGKFLLTPAEDLVESMTAALLKGMKEYHPIPAPNKK